MNDMKKEKVIDFSKRPGIADIVKKVARRKSFGNALDLGSGEGRHSIFLAQKGFSVTAVDIDANAITHLRKIARVKKLSILCQKGSIITYHSTKKFDIVIVINSLHFLKENQISSVVERIKSYTKSGGLVAIAVHTDKNPKGSRPHLFKKNELRRLFSDWDILEYAEKPGKLFITKATKKPVRKFKAEIIARKLN